jgi:DNA-binding transcriptional LysR family regulator
MLRKIEAAAGFSVIDRSGTPLEPTEKGREFIREALQILRIARAEEAAYAG